MKLRIKNFQDWFKRYMENASVRVMPVSKKLCVMCGMDYEHHRIGSHPFMSRLKRKLD